MIWEWFCERVKKQPQKLAVIDDDRTISYLELAQLAECRASELPDATGPRPWRVAIQSSNPSQFLISILACWKRGFSAVIIRDSMTPTQLAEIVKCLSPIAIMDGKHTFQASKSSRAVSLSKRDEALVICTSGTTGRPKLVALPAEGICLNADAIASALGLKAEDRIAVNTPLGFMYALMGGCMASLSAGATCRIFRPQEPLTKLQAEIRRENLTIVQGPPTLFRLFLSYWNAEPFPSVRLVTTGGEPLGKELAIGLSQAFPNAQRLFLYGMTEAGPRISHLSFDQGGGEDGCVGVPYKHLEWRLDSLDCNKVGRLILRGPGIFLGYIAPDGSYKGLDSEGFFHTNDLLSQSPDGNLYFRGRIDRIFRSGGRLINPEAVEKLLTKHPSVLEATCFAEPHHLLGLIPVAEVVIRPEATFDPSSILASCSQFCEPHARPRRISQIKKIELAESGKRVRTVPHKLDGSSTAT